MTDSDTQSPDFGKLIAQHHISQFTARQEVIGVAFAVVILTCGIIWEFEFDLVESALSVLGIITITGMLIYGARRFHSKRSIAVYEKGVCHIIHSNQTWWHWGELSIVRPLAGDKIPPQLLAYELYIHDEMVLRINYAFQRWLDLVNLLIERMSEQRLKMLIPKYNQGATVSFGWVSANRDGVKIEESVIPWAHIRSVQQSGNFSFLQIETNTGDVVQTDITRIPDGPLAPTLIGKLFREWKATNRGYEPQDDQPTTPRKRFVFETGTAIKSLMLPLAVGLFFILPIILYEIDLRSPELDWFSIDSAEPDTGQIVALLIMVAIGLWPITITITNFLFRLHITADQDALRVQTRRRERRWRWEEITKYHTRPFWNGTALSLTATDLYCRDERVLRLFPTRLTNYEGLMAVIQSQFNDRHLSSYRKRLNRGEILRFDKITINRDSITKGKKTIPWSQIKSWEIPHDDPYKIVLTGVDGKIELTFSKLEAPNDHLLLSLIRGKIESNGV